MNTNNKFILSIAAGSIVVVFLSLIIYKTNGNTNDDKRVKVINNSLDNNSTDYNKLNENPDDYTTYADFEEKESDKEKENIRKATQEDNLNYKFPGMEGGKTKKKYKKYKKDNISKHHKKE